MSIRLVFEKPLTAHRRKTYAAVVSPLVLTLLPLVAYGLILAGISYAARMKKGDDAEYFLAGRNLGTVPAFISVMATETSVATVVLFPTAGARSSMALAWLCLGYLAGRILAARLYLPALYNAGGLSIYAAMSANRPLANTGLTIFYLLSKYVSGGVRLFLGGLALQQLFGWHTSGWIVVIAIIVGVYSLSGGLRAVVVTDQLQGFLILMVGLALALALVFGSSQPLPELSFWNTDARYDNAIFFLALFCGGAVLSIGTHAADQDLLQRILAVRTLREAQKALILSAFAAGAVILLYLFVGSLLARESGLPARSPLVAYAAATPYPLLRGAFAALLAAASMSTMDSAIHSTGAVWKSLLANRGQGRHWSLLSLVLLTLAGIGFVEVARFEENLLALALGSMNYINGGLIGVLSIFVFFPKRTTTAGTFLALLGGLLITIACNFWIEPAVAWTWTIILASAGAFIVGLLPSLLLSPPDVQVTP